MATRDSSSVSAARKPMGFQQITLTGTPVGLTIPANSAGNSVGYAVIQCNGAAATDFAGWRDDGTNPTNTICMQLFSGQELDYSGGLADIKFVLGSGSPVLNVSYYA